MSRDETLKDRFARLKEMHRQHDEQQRRGFEDLRAGMELARRIKDDAHRARDADRARRSGRKPLDVAAIAAAGVAIADLQGFEEVSMRKIAALLGSGTMSLYHYVRTKEELLAAMEDVVLGEILVSPRLIKGEWRKAITAIATATREAYRRHPWALKIQSGTVAPGLNGLRHVEQSVAALESTGLAFEDRLAIMAVVDDYVFGHALRATEADRVGDRGTQALAQVADYMTVHLNPTDFPTLSAAIGDRSMAEFVEHLATMFRPDEWFDAGLEAILAGLAQRFRLP